MRSARWVPVAIGLSVLLTWFSWRAANPEAELYDRALAEIDRFGMIEDTLYRDLFTARAGLLRNYDPLVSEIDGLRQAIARLRATAQVDSQTTETINRLAASVDRQEELVECFKSRNAVLHNSLSFFTRFAVNSDQHDLDFAIRSAATAILHLTLDTSSVAVREAEERLDELDAQATGSGQVALVEPFLAHGRLLHRLLPSVDDILKTTLTLRQKQDQETLRTAILHRGGCLATFGACLSRDALRLLDRADSAPDLSGSPVEITRQRAASARGARAHHCGHLDGLHQCDSARH